MIKRGGKAHVILNHVVTTLLTLATISQSVVGEVEYSTLKFGPNSNYQIQMRANVNVKPPVIEMKACFPLGKWFGIGFGEHMTTAELVFFMGPSNTTMQRVVNTKMDPGSRPTRPQHIPDESPIYENQTVSSCGEGMI